MAVTLQACSGAVNPAAPQQPTSEAEALIQTEQVGPTSDLSITTAVNTDLDVTPTATEISSPEGQANATATPDLRLDPADWMEWPVVPMISDRAKQIYNEGIEKGLDPNVFSKSGDCQNITTYFLAVFEDPDQYRLGAEYAYLQETIYYYDGSFSRESMAVKGGMNVAAVLSPMRANQTYCKGGESPLDCELRLNNPSIMLVSMEEAWGEQNSAANYEKYMRMILDKIIANGTLPIIATKADNLEGDHRINETIVKLAYEYDIPLWNFWRAVQGLPNNGILADGFHLSHGYNQFDNKYALQSGWPVRNLTALQVLDSVRRQLAEMP
ncbi:MAG: hypothetical protein GXY37_04240 [Chloroflexi bacterium]|nr:hypothetical protein [Chloroflexota bacterium]